MTSVHTIKARVQEVMAKESEMVAKFLDAANRHTISLRRGQYVIYVEDDLTQVSLLKTLLGSHSSLKMLPADNAEDAKNILARKKSMVKCLVLDLGLGGPNPASGLEFLAWLRENYNDMCVMVLTNHVELVPELKRKYPDIEVHIKCEPMENLISALKRVTTPTMEEIKKSTHPYKNQG